MIGRHVLALHPGTALGQAKAPHVKKGNQTNSLKSMCMFLLVPMLLANMVAGSQPDGMAWILISRLLNWFCLASAVYVVVKTAGSNIVGILLPLVVITKSLSLYFSAVRLFALVYLFLVCLLFLLAGKVVVIEKPDLFRKQLFWIYVLNAPLMLLQIIGVGEWTQILTTHGISFTPSGEVVQVSKSPGTTLFTDEAGLWGAVTLIQARPAGFLHSNQVLAFVGVATLTLNLLAKGRRVQIRTALITFSAVLAMAKIVFFAFLVVGSYLVFSDKKSRRIVSLYAKCFIGWLILYRLFFPGLFEGNFGIDTFSISSFVRIANIASLFGVGGVLQEILFYQMGESGIEYTLTRKAQEFESLSGIAQVIEFWPLFATFVPLAGWSYSNGLLKLRNRFPLMARTITAALLGAFCTLCSMPFALAPIFWVVYSIVGLPVLAASKKDYYYSRFMSLERSMGRDQGSVAQDRSFFGK